MAAQGIFSYQNTPGKVWKTKNVSNPKYFLLLLSSRFLVFFYCITMQYFITVFKRSIESLVI